MGKEQSLQKKNGAGKTGQPYAKELKQATILHHTQQLTHTGLQTLDLKPYNSYKWTEAVISFTLVLKIFFFLREGIWLQSQEKQKQK